MLQHRFYSSLPGFILFHVVQIVKKVGFTACPEGQAMTSMVLALEWFLLAQNDVIWTNLEKICLSIGQVRVRIH